MSGQIVRINREGSPHGVEDSKTYSIESLGGMSRDNGLGLAKRAISSKSLDELFFILTNDARAVIDFERASVITHLGGPSRLVATNNEPELNKQTEFVTRMNKLASLLRNHGTALLFSGRSIHEDIPDGRIPGDLQKTLKSYIALSGHIRILLIPLIHDGAIISHLLYEFSSETDPNDKDIHSFLSLACFFGAALAEKYIAQQKPELKSLLLEQSSGTVLGARVRRYLPLSAIGLAAFVLVFFIIPFPFTIGGEAQVVPKLNYLAFCRTDGVIESVFVREGEAVNEGQLLARLDPKELDFQMMSWKAQYDILSHEMNRLVMEAGEKPSSLAERKLVGLKREVASTELRFLQWKKEFLDIRTPVSGIILTKDIQTLAGKRLRSGDTFCEIAVPEELLAQIYVPEERIAYVGAGQDVNVYLNSDPTRGYGLKLEEISPMAEVQQRLGTVYRVTAPFKKSHESLKVGMKGVGRIYVFDTSLWRVISERLATRWNQWRLYL